MKDFLLNDVTEEEISATMEQILVEEENKPSLSKLRQMFKHYDTTCSTHRAEAFRDRRYFDGDQIGAAWKKHMEDNDLPIVPINLIKDNISAHVGLIASQQTDVRAFSRNTKGVNAAEVATKLLRYAIDQSRIDNKIREEADSFFVEGIAAVLIECDTTSIYTTEIDFRDLIYDPDSRRTDFSDAKWMGFSRWIEEADIRAAYPEAYSEINPHRDSGTFFDLDASNGFQKDTDEGDWFTDKKLIRVIEMYYLKGGKWWNVVWCHKGILDFGESQYQDDRGNSLCPIVAKSCHVMGDPEAKNQRYGQVRDLIYPQDDYNARRAAALKYMMSKQIEMVNPNAQPVDANTLRAEAQKRITIMPDGYKMTDTSVSAEQVSFMQMAGQEIQRLSPTAMVTGTNLPNDASGRSRQMAAAGGRLSLSPVLVRFQEWRDQIYRHIWYRISQYWHEQMEIRVTGSEYAPKYMMINNAIIDENQPEIAQPIIDPETGEMAVNPETGQPEVEMIPNIVGYENAVAEMDMDFKIKTVEQHDNIEAETWETLMQLMGSLGVRPGTPEFRMTLEWAPIPNKLEVIERYDAQMEKVAAENAEQMQMQAQIAQIKEEIEMLQGKAKADKDTATAEEKLAKTQRSMLETQMLADGHNTEQELAAVIAQQFYR